MTKKKVRPDLRPDVIKHDPHPAYLRALITGSGLSQSAAARRLGICERAMRNYLAEPGTTTRATPAPYLVQYALERLATRG